MAKKIACPSCGAMGEEGKECAFCGTLITPKVKKASKKETEDNESPNFSWEDWDKVCPALYKISASKVAGNDSDVLYMVVENINDVSYRGIINREGQFVKGPGINISMLFPDSYEYVFHKDDSCFLTVLATGEDWEIGRGIDFKTSEQLDENYRYLVVNVYVDYGYEYWTAFFDRHNKKLIKFSEPAYYYGSSYDGYHYLSVYPLHYKLLERTTTNDSQHFIFGYGEGDQMTITIKNDRAIVSGAQKRKKTKMEEEAEENERWKERRNEQEKQEFAQKVFIWGAVIIFAIIMGMMLCWFVYKMKHLGSEYSASWYLE